MYLIYFLMKFHMSMSTRPLSSKTENQPNISTVTILIFYYL